MAEVLKMDGRIPETRLQEDAMAGQVLTFGPYLFVPGDGLWQHGRSVPLPPRALAVLTALLATPGTVVTKQQLMDAAWPGTFVTDSSLLEAIGLLRDVLGDDRRQPTYIQTVHRRGYRFIGLSAEAPHMTAASPRVEPEFPPFFSGPEWRPIVAACVTYALTTVVVAIVFALFGQPRVALPMAATRHAIAEPASPGFAISHTGLLLLQPPGGGAISPSWNGEGLELAFAFSKAGPLNLMGTWRQFPTSRSNDGRQLAFTEINSSTGADIWVMDLQTRARRALVHSISDETWARFSPDGRWIAYMSNESGRWEVYRRAASGDGGPVRVSTNGGAWPSWSADGRVYFSHSGRADLRVMLDWFSEIATRVGPG